MYGLALSEVIVIAVLTVALMVATVRLAGWVVRRLSSADRGSVDRE
jgi:hypothetical protein